VDIAVIGSGLLFALPGVLPWLLLRTTLANRDSAGALGLLVIIPAVSVYAIAFAVRTVTTTPWLWYVAANIGLVAIASATVGWFLLTAEYTGYIDRPQRALGAFSVLLVVDQIFAWTNPLHHRYYDPIASLSLPTAGIAPIGGSLFQLHAVGAYLLVLLGIIACLREVVNSQGIRRKQNLVLIGAVALPAGANISYLGQLTAQNYTSLMFVATVFILAWVLFEADFLDVVPRGRERAVQNMDDPMVILNDDEQVVESNPAARALVGVESDWEGLPVGEFFEPFCDQADVLQSPTGVETDISITTADRQRDFQLRSAPLAAGGDETGGWVITLHEITQVKQRERVLQQLHTKTAAILDERDRNRICSAAVSAIKEVLGVTEAGVYLYNRRAEALVPVATSMAFDGLFADNAPDSQEPDSLLWAVYKTGTETQIADRRELQRVFGDAGRVERALLLPLGSHGLLVLPATETTTLGEIEQNFARLLSTSVETALDKARRERGLATVQDITRDAVAATTTDEMAEMVLDELPEALDFPLSAIWEHDPTTQQLQPVDSTGPADPLFDETPVFTPGNSIAWRAFEERETKLISQISDYPEAYDQEGLIKSEVISPIGEFGVFAAGSLHDGRFTENDKQILASLTTNLQAATQLIERRRDLQLLDQVLGRILRHNLRNELTVIKGYAETIEAEANEQHQTMGETIVESAKRLQKTTDNAQTMREVVANRDETSTVSLIEVVEDAIGSVRDKFPGAEIQGECAADATVTAHPNINDAVQQLIENGIEHNDSETPTVDVRLFATGDGPAIEVADNGPGIPRMERDVLDKHGESALEHGSGAGLWVIDRVAAYSNVDLEFTIDQGTVVQLTFPSTQTTKCVEL
jgi:His Kinase A (phosphoacceptor) domain./Histidine kinase-, DNA gyrase B-, and HSP90-like ATPase.